MEGTFAFPVSDGTGENREGRKEALVLLEQAGYRLEKGKLRDKQGQPVSFEILAATRAEERLLLTYARALEAGRHRCAHPPGRLGAVSAAQADL